MKDIILQIGNQNCALYLRIADALRRAITEGRVVAGEALPSTRRLADQLQCHRHTVLNAMAELAAEGWLVALPRRGYRVASVLPSHLVQFDGLAGSAPAQRAEWRFTREAPEVLRIPYPEFTDHAFRSEAPDLRLFPAEEFKAYLGRGLKLSKETLLDYGSPQGHQLLIDELSHYLRRIRGITGRTIVITHGAQEAIFLCAQLLLGPGNLAAVEPLGYPPAWAAFRAAGADVLPLSCDEQGPEPSSFERLARQHDIRLLYLSPLHQFPTMATLTKARRQAIYRIAARHDIPILEDDYDHEFHYRCQPLAPLASDDPAHLVIYVSSFAKVIAPSVRIGFLALPDHVAPAFVNYLRIMSRHNDSVLQDALARWMRDGGFERHVLRMAQSYQHRRDVMVDTLRQAIHAGCRLSFKVPDGGMALWLNIWRNSKHFADQARRAGILVQPESLFRLDGDTGTHLRLGFANQNPDELTRGIAKMISLLKTQDQAK